MKAIGLMAAILLVATVVHGQEKIEIVKIKNEDRSVDVSIANYSESAYEVSVQFETEGYRVEKQSSATFMVPADSTMYVAKLVPMAAQTRYKIHYRAVAEDSAAEVSFVTAPDVIFYSKNGQKASTETRIYLEKHKIPYREYNVSYSKDTKDQYTAMLKRRGLKSEDVKLPILVIKGEVFHTIKDLPSLLQSKL